MRGPARQAACHRGRSSAQTSNLERRARALGVDVQRTDDTVSGPSRLYKVVLGEEDDDGGDDGMTVSFGCRPA